MKIIHCADIHLGSKIEAKLKEISKDRKSELRTTFDRMIDYAVDNDIKIILLAGDIFDSDAPLKKDKDFFYDAIKKHPDIDFIYLRGNHDLLETFLDDEIPNLKKFTDEWSYYRYDEVVIAGVEMTSSNTVSMYSSLKLNPFNKNIVMLHGEIADSIGKNKIDKNKLRNQSIDYLALGHIHSYSHNKLDERGTYVYSGCLEGRGFDELGEKGFVVIDTETSISHQFVPFAKRTIREVNIDISGAQSAYDALSIVKRKFQANKKDIYRILLTGDVNFEILDLKQDIKNTLSEYYFISVKDQTNKLIDSEAFQNDPSLKGEFVRTVFASNDYTDAQKKAIIMLGLKLLQGREID